MLQICRNYSKVKGKKNLIIMFCIVFQTTLYCQMTSGDTLLSNLLYASIEIDSISWEKEPLKDSIFGLNYYKKGVKRRISYSKSSDSMYLGKMYDFFDDTATINFILFPQKKTIGISFSSFDSIQYPKDRVIFFL